MLLGKLIDKFRSSREDEELADYVDRLLEGGDTAGAPEHLREEAEEIARTATLLRQVEQAPAPRSFALGPEYARAPRKQSWLSRLSAPQAPAMAAAAAVLALAVVVSGDMGGYLQDQDAAGQPAVQEEGPASGEPESALAPNDGEEAQLGPEDDPGEVTMLQDTVTPDKDDGAESEMTTPESTAEPEAAGTPTGQG
ncbi:MAG: hypothetical protein ACOC5K_02635, partial [Chloroflexota bacterium]